MKVGLRISYHLVWVSSNLIQLIQELKTISKWDNLNLLNKVHSIKKFMKKLKN